MYILPDSTAVRNRLNKQMNVGHYVILLLVLKFLSIRLASCHHFQLYIYLTLAMHSGKMHMPPAFHYGKLCLLVFIEN